MCKCGERLNFKLKEKCCQSTLNSVGAKAKLIGHIAWINWSDWLLRQFAVPSICWWYKRRLLLLAAKTCLPRCYWSIHNTCTADSEEVLLSFQSHEFSYIICCGMLSLMVTMENNPHGKISPSFVQISDLKTHTHSETQNSGLDNSVFMKHNEVCFVVVFSSLLSNALKSWWHNFSLLTWFTCFSLCQLCSCVYFDIYFCNRMKLK